MNHSSNMWSRHHYYYDLSVKYLTKNNAPYASIIPAMYQKTFFAQMKIKSFPNTGYKWCQYQFNFKIENDAGIFTVVISSFQAQIKDAGSQPASLKHVAGRICIYKPNQKASMTLEQIKPGASISVGGIIGRNTKLTLKTSSYGISNCSYKCEE